MLVAAALLLSACASNAEIAQPVGDGEPIEDAESTSTTAPPEEPELVGDDEPDSSETSTNVAPAVPNVEFDENAASSNPATAWISRRSMTAEAIELVWSAEVEVASFEIHRLQAVSDSQPQSTEMTEQNRIHSSPDVNVFLDSDVVEGERYWYGVRGLDSAGEVLATGWHRADAITDNEPPSPAEVAVTVENGVVSLSWTPPDENYQLHAYRVLRGVDGAELETVVTTWNLNQTSFVDAEPPDGSLVYAVEAVDFHWNTSELSTVAVDLGS